MQLFFRPHYILQLCIVVSNPLFITKVGISLAQGILNVCRTDNNRYKTLKARVGFLFIVNMLKHLMHISILLICLTNRMKMRKSYPVYFKWAYATAKEEKLIPLSVRKEIPKQTRSLWRNLPPSVVAKIEDDLNKHEGFASFISDDGPDKIQLYRLTGAMTRFQSLVVDLLKTDQYIDLLSNGKEGLVALVERYKEFFDKKKILKWLKLPPAKYESWLTQTRYNCTSSVQSLCARQYANQTTQEEFEIINQSLESNEYIHWPKSAVHAKLLRDERLQLSRSTFYKYAKISHPNSNRKKGYRQKRKVLKANYVNEYWHLDISVFRTLDGQKNYIYALIDRYSRKILSYAIRQAIRSKYASEVLLEALGVEKPRALQIISDGGPENTGKHIRHVLADYIEKHPVDITHKIALKDIDYSNNMIERFFNTMKTGYLYLQNIESSTDLERIVVRLINEYNYVRPHYAHGLLTPHEAYLGLQQPDLSAQINKAKKERIQKNKNCSCKVCIC